MYAQDLLKFHAGSVINDLIFVSHYKPWLVDSVDCSPGALKPSGSYSLSLFPPYSVEFPKLNLGFGLDCLSCLCNEIYGRY